MSTRNIVRSMLFIQLRLDMSIRFIHKAFRAILVPLCMWLVPAMHAQAPTVAEQYLFAQVNAERVNAGLSPLQHNDALTGAARQHALRMGASGMLEHQLSGEPDLMQRASAGATYFPVVTENIGEGPTAIDLHRALMESPHHRENILDPEVNVAGIAAVPYRGELWVVEDFGRVIVPVTYAEQERQVAGLLQQLGLHEVQMTERARTMCGMDTGFTGPRPAFVMRYAASALSRLPAELSDRISDGNVSKAEVGACAPDRSGDFSVYNIAIALYR